MPVGGSIAGAAAGHSDAAVITDCGVSTSGVLVTTQGWSLLNLGSLVPLLLVASGLLWLGRHRRAMQPEPLATLPQPAPLRRGG